MKSQLTLPTLALLMCSCLCGPSNIALDVQGVDLNRVNPTLQYTAD